MNDLTRKRFGRLVVLHLHERREKGKAAAITRLERVKRLEEMIRRRLQESPHDNERYAYEIVLNYLKTGEEF